MADENWSTQLRKGVLELCILNLLRREGLYGYAIVKRLTEYPGLVITEGTVYPLLSRLRREGMIQSTLVESANGPARRVYVLTPAGRRQLIAMNREWTETSKMIGRLVSGDEERSTR